MTTNVWNIMWRDRRTGTIIDTAAVDYTSWEAADNALITLLRWRVDYTPTIERNVKVLE